MTISKFSTIKTIERITRSNVFETHRETQTSYKIICEFAERAAIVAFLLKKRSLKRSDGLFGSQNDWLDGTEGTAHFITLNEKAFTPVYKLCTDSGWIE
jgi:hypothetical protein